jgi:hypothetical protein
MPRERGGPLCGRFAKGERAANQADLRVSQRRAAFCYKICGLTSLMSGQWRFLAL